jgi:ribose transport system ATP-binding protein
MAKLAEISTEIHSRVEGNAMKDQHILEMQNVTKDFPGVRALENVSLQLRKGEVHALVGENGAGKSTLMRILFGVHQKDSGNIMLRGEEVSILNPSHAQRLGISMVHQELNLVPQMNAAQNIALGHETTHAGAILDWPAVYGMCRENLAKLGAEDINSKVPVRKLSVAHRQLVEIAKALSWNAEIIVMDEPTSSLTESEAEELFSRIKSLRDRGVSVIFISHHIDEIFRIADRVTVLRDGKNVATREISDVDSDSLIHMMVGRAVNTLFEKEQSHKGGESLRVEGLERRGVLHDIHFTAYKGEILGIAGLVGSGRTELVRAIFGADPIDAGEIYIEGKRVRIKSPQDAINNGISLLTEDRKGQGMVLLMPVKDNIVLASMEKVSRGLILNLAKMRELAAKYVSDLNIRTPSVDRAVKYLSGGNQQKVIVAKWLCKNSSIFIFDEPTRGIDVGAKVEVHRLMNHLAQQGASILMISSELPEILGMSDRILVMREGRIVGELDRDAATQETIMAYATGGVKA